MIIQAFKTDWRRIHSRYEFQVALLVGALFALAGIAETNQTNGLFATLNTLRPPNVASLLGYSQVGDVLFAILPLLATLPCAWYYHFDVENHLLSISLSRLGRSSYFLGRVITISFTAFLVSVFPYALNLLFSLLAYPFPAYGLNPNNVYDFSAFYFTRIRNSILFPSLFLNKPVEHALLLILLIGIYGVLMALLSYSITLYFRKNMAVTMLLTTVLAFSVILFLNIFGLTAWVLPLHLSTDLLFVSGNIKIVMLEYLLLTLLNTFLVASKLIINKDVLV